MDLQLPDGGGLGLLSALWLAAAVAAGLGLWHETDEVLDSALAETAQRLLLLPEAALAAPDTAEPLATLGAPDELQPWLATVNGLLAQVAALIEGKRSFAANTAHELRTPLAAARAQAQRLVQASADPATRAPAQALLRQLDRLTRLATRLLQLARIESGVALQRGTVDLVQLAVLVADDFAAAQPDRQRAEVRRRRGAGHGACSRPAPAGRRRRPGGAPRSPGRAGQALRSRRQP